MIRANTVPPEPSGTSAIGACPGGAMLHAARSPASARKPAAASWASISTQLNAALATLEPRPAHRPDRATGSSRPAGCPAVRHDGQAEVVTRDGRRVARRHRRRGRFTGLEEVEQRHRCSS